MDVPLIFGVIWDASCFFGKKGRSIKIRRHYISSFVKIRRRKVGRSKIAKNRRTSLIYLLTYGRSHMLCAYVLSCPTPTKNLGWLLLSHKLNLGFQSLMDQRLPNKVLITSNGPNLEVWIYEFFSPFFLRGSSFQLRWKLTKKCQNK